MSSSPLTAETDLSEPASKGDILFLESRLMNEIRVLSARTDRPPSQSLDTLGTTFRGPHATVDGQPQKLLYRLANRKGFLWWVFIIMTVLFSGLMTLYRFIL